MAAKKKKKAKKAAKRPAAKKSRTAARKTKKAPAKKKKTVKAARKKAPARKAAKAKAAKKPAKKKKQIVGEGDYQASRSFLKDQSSFVAKNRDRIPNLGQEAERALEGPEGQGLRDAEAAAAGRSRDTF